METEKKNAKARPRARLMQAPMVVETASRKADSRLRQEIWEELAAAGGPLAADALFAAFAAVHPNADRAAFDGALSALAAECAVEVGRQGEYAVPPAKRWLRGQVVGRDGYGLFLPDGGGESLTLSSAEMERVFPGDTVLVARSGRDVKGNPAATIRRIVARNTTTVVGTLSRVDNVLWLRPEDPQCPHAVRVVAGGDDVAAGAVVVARIDRQPEEGAAPEGTVVETLGCLGDPGLEIEIAVRRFGLPHVFSDAALAEAAALPDGVRAADCKGRVDLTDVPLVTIDGADSRDFDDAVYAEPHGEGFRLVVAIADVSWYVRPGQPLDVDAQQRMTSVYFPRRVIPMLPEKLSNGLCSLNPGVRRCALVCDAVLDGKGETVAYQFYPAVIRSHARLTYEEVWAALSEGAVSDNIAPVLPAVRDLQGAFHALLSARARRGALDFETVETRMVCGEAGRIEGIVPYERTDAHRMIEEAMLVANTCAADFLERNHAKGLFRVHAGPAPERLAKLRAELAGWNLTLGGGDNPQPKDYFKVVEEIAGKPQSAALQAAMLRSMSQAVYSPHNIGHYGLGYARYTHFTSPIRRYPDLMAHRVIRALLAGKRFSPKLCGAAAPASYADRASRLVRFGTKPARGALLAWESLGVACSACERRADEASWDVGAWLKCVFMGERIGQTFEGTVTSVMPFGVFVTLDDVHVEGLVRVSEIGWDFYVWSESQHALVGEDSGDVYKIGRRVVVRVSDADPESRRIDFSIADYGRFRRSARDSVRGHKGGRNGKAR